jgi:carotenoid cleavage dioxygenase
MPIATAGTLGPGWNTIVRVDMAQKGQDRWWVGENAACQEPQFVPRRAGAAEGDGWLLVMLTRLGPQGYASELAILDAERIAEGPLARVRSPIRLRAAIHGNWVAAQTPNRRTT